MAEEKYAAIYNRNRVTWLYAAARSPDLSATAVRVGLLFATFFKPETREVLKPSYKWLMKHANVHSRTTLFKVLKELEDGGFLVIHRTHRYKNEYSMPFTGEERWKR